MSADDFADAEVISGTSGSTAFDLTGATSETGEPIPADGLTVWFSWTAPDNNPTQFDTAASSGDPDTYLSVYTGSSVGALTLIVDDDDSANDPDVGDPDYGTSRLHFTPTSGVTYYIQIDTFEASPVTGVLTWAPYVEPPPAPTAGTWTQAAGRNFHTAWPGDDIIVTGTDLDAVTTVTIGDFTQASFTATDSTHLTITVGSNARSGPIVVSNSSGSDNASGFATVIFPGPWIQPATTWGPEQDSTDVDTVMHLGGREFWPGNDDTTLSELYGSTDNSVSRGAGIPGSGTSAIYTSISQGGDWNTAVDVRPGGTGLDRSHGFMGQGGGYIDVPGGDDDARHLLMPPLDVDFPDGALDMEVESETGVFADGLRVQPLIFRQLFETTSVDGFTGTLQHPATDWTLQIRRLPESRYVVYDPDAPAPAYPAWSFPDDLSGYPVLLEAPATAPGPPTHTTINPPSSGPYFPPEYYPPLEVLVEEDSDVFLGEDIGVIEVIGLDDEARLGLVTTFDAYAAGTTLAALRTEEPGGPTRDLNGPAWLNPVTGVYQGATSFVSQPSTSRIVLSARYTPPRYRFLYEEPPGGGWTVGRIAWGSGG